MSINLERRFLSSSQRESRDGHTGASDGYPGGEERESGEWLLPRADSSGAGKVKCLCAPGLTLHLYTTCK